jgi:hypothetical protein
MAGFVDVSGMTDYQVKTLCQADEDYKPARSQRYTRPRPVMHDTSTAFAVAFAAFCAVGNEYVKAGSFTTNSEGKMVPQQSNRELMVQMLADQSTLTDFDREMGEKIRTHYKGLLFKILGGKVLNEFDAKALALANGETVSERDLGTIAYLPAGYERATVRQSVEDRISDARGDHIGVVGDKVSFTGEVLKVVFSQQWTCYFVTVITDEDQVAFFSLKFSIDIGRKISVTGTVKTHADKQVTKMTRVKIS